jgi:adrenodoxin-NADP+ reductase
MFQQQSFTNEADAFDPSASVKAIPNDTKIIPTSLAFRSIGYKSTPLPGLSNLGIQFDTRRGIIPNVGGRVIQVQASQPGLDTPLEVPGIYVAGWVKRGPVGVIASTMEDAFATADCLAEDIRAGRPFLNGQLEKNETGDGWHGVQKELQAKRISLRSTNWKDWQRIDKTERERGARLGKEREKITCVDEMLQILDG